MIHHTTYRSQIETVCAQFGLDADLVEALVLVESNGHADAFRHEPQYAARYRIAERYPQWPVRATASSYGLMQIMYPTAQGLGYQDEPEGLFLPAINLHFGGLQLKGCFDWAAGFKAVSEADIVRAALCGYNGGRNSLTSPKNPRPANIAYASKILALAAQTA